MTEQEKLNQLMKNGWSYRKCAVPTPTGNSKVLVTDNDGKMMWQDRTHWSDKETVTIVEETTTFGGFGEFMVVNGVKSDGKYTVLYNGAEYECTPKTDPSGELALGNLKLAKSTLEDTGEPFLLTGMSIPGTYTYAMFADKQGTHTFSVTELVEKIHKLDSEYLPDNNGAEGQFAVSDGKGGIAWKTLHDAEEVSY